MINRLGLEVTRVMEDYMSEITKGDIKNREATAAEIYFTTLFGKEFVRHNKNDLNIALNYGYTILCSIFSRLIVLHGYSTALGIHHKSRRNPVNLSSDMMEPFRPFVDEIVYNNQGAEFDNEYKKKLISLPYKECIYDGCKRSIGDAIDLFILDVVSAMEAPRKEIKEVEFVGKV